MEDDNYEPSTWGWVADHVERYLAPDDEGFDMQGAPCILLTTTGRRTGKTRISPLIKVHDGNNYLLIASKGGAPKNPLWFDNLVADPNIIVQDEMEVLECTARIATPEEKAERWPVAVAAWPDYAEYQKNTDRDIPLIICEPR
jgi:deazaflavin-dependent oxidoreductase (nitroreductase family)